MASELAKKHPATSYDLSSPKEGESERVYETTRICWDKAESCWRIVPFKHCPRDINPFDNYVPVPPFTEVYAMTTSNKRRAFLTDQRGVRVSKNGGVNRTIYVKADFFQHLAKKHCVNSFGERKERQLHRMGRFILAAASGIPDLKRYFDNGRPKPETVMALYVELMKIVFTQPQVVANFMEQLANRVADDPIATLHEMKQLTGMPINVFNMNAGEGAQYVKLDIFTAPPELPPDETAPEARQVIVEATKEEVE